MKKFRYMFIAGVTGALSLFPQFVYANPGEDAPKQPPVEAVDQRIPQALLGNAKCVVLFPEVVQAGFVVGGKYGRGMVSCRDAVTGDWGTPVFLRLTSLNWGIQIGAQSADVIMLIMNDKGLTTRDTTSRTHIYSAAIKELPTKNNLLTRFIDATFQGSAAQLVMEALGNNDTTNEELEQIKALIEKIEKQ